MSRSRQALIAFWALIIITLLWQLYQYNQTLSVPTQADVDARKQYFFIHTNDNAHVAAPGAPAAVADVKQVAFNVQAGVPTSSMFTCTVTLKNIGTMKATGVQAQVRPYKGGSTGDEDVGGIGGEAPLADNDPRAQTGQWLTFPDLAPGETVSENATFVTQQNCNPGHNPDPQITFQTEKGKP